MNIRLTKIFLVFSFFIIHFLYVFGKLLILFLILLILFFILCIICSEFLGDIRRKISTVNRFIVFVVDIVAGFSGQ